MKIVVTGGAGFIGGNFCTLLYVRQTQRITLVCLGQAHICEEHMETLAGVMENPHFTFIKRQDICR